MNRFFLLQEFHCGAICECGIASFTDGATGPRPSPFAFPLWILAQRFPRATDPHATTDRHLTAPPPPTAATSPRTETDTDNIRIDRIQYPHATENLAIQCMRQLPGRDMRRIVAPFGPFQLQVGRDEFLTKPFLQDGTCFQGAQRIQQIVRQLSNS